MHPVVCARFMDSYIAINRIQRIGVKLKEDQFLFVGKALNGDKNLSSWVWGLLAKLGCKPDRKTVKLKDIVLFRPVTGLSFGRASYEITEACNYCCAHCYLGNKVPSSLSLGDKLSIIESIVASGCVWLQITGGEPLVDPDFEAVYRSAYRSGCLITISTNGSHIERFSELFSQLPPYRMTISLYGITALSYESLTGISGSYDEFIKGVESAFRLGLRIRFNIIVTKYNEHEIEYMVELAKKYGAEYFIYYNLSPTIKGYNSHREIQARDCSIATISDSRGIENKNCLAGQTFFHVDCRGEASICKIARDIRINFLRDGTGGLVKLRKISESLLKRPIICGLCPREGNCNTCTPRIILYSQSVCVPESVCQLMKGGDFNG